MGKLLFFRPKFSNKPVPRPLQSSTVKENHSSLAISDRQTDLHPFTFKLEFEIFCFVRVLLEPTRFEERKCGSESFF